MSHATSQRVDVASKDEWIARGAFNEMAASLAQRTRNAGAEQNLELKVGERTEELEKSNQALPARLPGAAKCSEHLVQSKNGSLGQLVAGIAIEIKNPLTHLRQHRIPGRYVDRLKCLIRELESLPSLTPRDLGLS